MTEEEQHVEPGVIAVLLYLCISGVKETNQSGVHAVLRPAASIIETRGASTPYTVLPYYCCTTITEKEKLSIIDNVS